MKNKKIGKESLSAFKEIIDKSISGEIITIERTTEVISKNWKKKVVKGISLLLVGVSMLTMPPIKSSVNAQTKVETVVEQAEQIDYNAKLEQAIFAAYRGDMFDSLDKAKEALDTLPLRPEDSTIKDRDARKLLEIILTGIEKDLVFSNDEVYELYTAFGEENVNKFFQYSAIAPAKSFKEYLGVNNPKAVDEWKKRTESAIEKRSIKPLEDKKITIEGYTYGPGEFGLEGAYKSIYDVLNPTFKDLSDEEIAAKVDIYPQRALSFAEEREKQIEGFEEYDISTKPKNKLSYEETVKLGKSLLLNDKMITNVELYGLTVAFGIDITNDIIAEIGQNPETKYLIFEGTIEEYMGWNGITDLNDWRQKIIEAFKGERKFVIYNCGPFDLACGSSLNKPVEDIIYNDEKLYHDRLIREDIEVLLGDGIISNYELYLLALRSNHDEFNEVISLIKANPDIKINIPFDSFEEYMEQNGIEDMLHWEYLTNQADNGKYKFTLPNHGEHDFLSRWEIELAENYSDKEEQTMPSKGRR